MNKLAFIALFFFSGITVFAQENNNVKQQATEMGNALLKKDYISFVEFAYPKIVRQMGGKEKMAGSIQQQMEGIEKGGSHIVALDYGDPSTIIKEKKELQCTIPQTMTLRISGGRVLSKTTIIAISQDNGEHWYFIDAGERDLATVRISLPNISKRLTLPAPAAPQFIKD